MEQLGRFEIIRLLARGGMSTLHVAREVAPGGAPSEQVVLKRLLPQLAADPELRQLFVDEARIAATLAHPNIVRVVALGTDGPEPWFAMEYLHGEDLRRVLEALSRQERALPYALAVSIVRAACAGLEHAHERGLVHRDVSPQNLLVTYAGQVKLIDFGIARVVRRLKERTQRVVGNVHYMAPEQLAGGAPGATPGATIDRRSDVFSLSVVLWELTVGKRLFRGVSDEVIEQLIVQEDAPPPSSFVSGYPPELEAIVMRGLARSPEARWPTARAMGEALAGWAAAAGQEPTAEALARFVEDLFATSQPLPAGAEDTLETPKLDLAPPPLGEDPPSLTSTAQLPRPSPRARFEARSETAELRTTLPRRRLVPYLLAAAVAAVLAACALALRAHRSDGLAAGAAAPGLAPIVAPDLGRR